MHSADRHRQICLRTSDAIFTARCYASAVLAMALCLSVSVCLSVTSRSSTKTAKQRITLVNNTTRWFCDYQGCCGDEISITYPSHTHRKSCGYPYRILIPTEPQNPTYPYPHPVFSLQEAYFNLLFVTLTVGYYMMYVLCESFCDWSADWLVGIKRLLSWVLISKTIFEL